ncbi:MAG TPA: MerC domain-containing protein [Candidatus Tectomicrobia bacterium]
MGRPEAQAWRVFIVLGAALTMIAVGRFLANESYELVFVIMGAVVLAGGHLLNGCLCLTCRLCEDEDARGRS